MASRKWPQYLITFLSNVSIFTFGMQGGWLSPLQPAFQSASSPLGEGTPPMTDEEISWIGSLPSISLTFGAPLFGYLMDRLGRKTTCLIATAPNVITYLLLLFGSDVYYVYVARLIGGFCSSGGFVVAPIYISETADREERGFLTGLVGTFIKVGIIFSFVVGGYSTYFVLNFSSLMFSLIFLLFYYWMPESPYYLLSKNKRKEARLALQTLRGDDQKVIDTEMNEIENLLNECRSHEVEKFTLKHLLTTRANAKAMMIICGIFTVQMMGGYPAIIRYTVDIFQNSGVSYSPYLAAILIATSQFLAAFVGAALLDRVGRKNLLLYSTALMSLSMACTSIILYMKEFESMSSLTHPLRFLPTAFLLLYSIGYATGYGSVPFVIVPELFAPEARASACSYGNMWCSFLEFVVVKAFLSITALIGLHGSLFIFACTSAAGVVFISFVMFETKGLELDEILRKLRGEPRKQEDNVVDPFIRNRTQSGSSKCNQSSHTP